MAISRALAAAIRANSFPRISYNIGHLLHICKLARFALTERKNAGRFWCAHSTHLAALSPLCPHRGRSARLIGVNTKYLSLSNYISDKMTRCKTWKPLHTLCFDRGDFFPRRWYLLLFSSLFSANISRFWLAAHHELEHIAWNMARLAAHCRNDDISDTRISNKHPIVAFASSQFQYTDLCLAGTPQHHRSTHTQHSS